MPRVPLDGGGLVRVRRELRVRGGPEEEGERVDERGEMGARDFQLNQSHAAPLQVCSNHNETFATDCDLYRKRCLCEESAAGDEDEMGAGSACGEDNMYSHVHVEYYGDC